MILEYVTKTFNGFLNKVSVMNWYQIKKYLYYTHDDFVRDIIALHL